MGLLSGWFMAGLAAVAAPIIFHMIRRTPSGRIPFSTTMFLDPSPPRISKRSRIENWPLLLLRGLALTLLALAFARPFFRSAATDVTETASEKQVAILLDRSASMQRGELWSDAKQKVLDAFDEASVADQMALYAFDNRVEPILTFREWRDLQPETRREILKERLNQLKPSWGATNIGQALIVAADDLESLEMESDDKSDEQAKSTVRLISDIQQGSAIESLQNYEWPETIEVAVDQIKTDGATNAGLELMTQSDVDENLVRVRVSNSADSDSEEFEVKWIDTNGKVLKQPRPVYVARSRSRIVSFEPPTGVGSSKIVLSGDAHEFDNTLFVDQLNRTELSVLYVGTEDPNDPESLRFYLTRAFPQTPARSVNVIPPKLNGVTTPMDSSISLVVIADKLEADRLDELRKYTAAGGTTLYVAQSADGVASIAPILTDDQEFDVTEAEVKNYSLVEQVDFTHPVFAPFSDAQFADFTRIHFWKHRSLPTRALTDARILARFDNGDPAIIEKTIGLGRVFVFSGGWQPADSELALSTKFVPLLNNILEQGDNSATILPRMQIGDELKLQPFRISAKNLSVLKPDGNSVELAEDATVFDGTDQPGVYQLNAGPTTARFAVNVDPHETDTSVMATEQLESLGVLMERDNKDPANVAAAESRERQLKIQELEKQQKLWRWLVIAAIAVLFVETWLAGRMAAKQSLSPAPASQGGTA